MLQHEPQKHYVKQKKLLIDAKTTYCLISFLWRSGKGKFIETESRLAVAWGWGWERGVSFGGAGKVIKLDSGDGSTNEIYQNLQSFKWVNLWYRNYFLIKHFFLKNYWEPVVCNPSNWVSFQLPQPAGWNPASVSSFLSFLLVTPPTPAMPLNGGLLCFTTFWVIWNFRRQEFLFSMNFLFLRHTIVPELASWHASPHLRIHTTDLLSFVESRPANLTEYPCIHCSLFLIYCFPTSLQSSLTLLMQVSPSMSPSHRGLPWQQFLK